MSLVLQSGTFESTLDDKGRVVIPASLRDRYKGELVITQGRDCCAWIMTAQAYEEFLDYLENISTTISFEEYNANQYHHVVPAQIAEIDQKSGRVSIPSAIRSYARLSKECLVLCINGYLEIWNAESYRIHAHEMQLIAKEASRKVGPFRFIPNKGQA